MSELFTDKIKTNPDVQVRVREWIDALRSGRYAQARHQLRKGEAFCCLGVACDIYDRNGWVGDVWSDGGETTLSPEVTEEFALSEYNGEFRVSDNETMSLASLNDKGKSFSEIADVIEHELLLSSLDIDLPPAT